MSARRDGRGNWEFLVALPAIVFVIAAVFYGWTGNRAGTVISVTLLAGAAAQYLVVFFVDLGLRTADSTGGGSTPAEGPNDSAPDEGAPHEREERFQPRCGETGSGEYRAGKGKEPDEYRGEPSPVSRLSSFPHYVARDAIALLFFPPCSRDAIDRSRHGGPDATRPEVAALPVEAIA